MDIKLDDASGFVGGKITGSSDLKIKGVAKIQEAEQGDLTFLYHPAYEKYFHSTKASAIIVKPDFKKNRDDITYIEVDEPEKAFFKIINRFFFPGFQLEGIDTTASIHKSAEVGINSAIGKNVVISSGCKIGKNVKIFHNTVLLENVTIGSNSIIFPSVTIRENCIIGERVIIHSNSVIGSDGFGYYNDKEGKYIKISQIGNVIIEDDVELGSNVSIDRAAIGSTIIKRGVKIDNLVQIAHNVFIDEDTVMSAQSGVSGSTKVGKKVILAGQVGLVGHIEIADNVVLYAQSGISKSIKKPGAYFGSPAKELKTALKQEAHIRNLPEYAEKIKTLEEEIIKLRDELKNSASLNK